MSKLIFNGHSYTGGSINPNLATDVVYDNADSGLSANNVQSAIDEVNRKPISVKTINLTTDFIVTGRSDTGSRILLYAPFPFLMADTTYTATCNYVNLPSIAVFTSGISVDIKYRTGVLIIVNSSVLSAGSSACGIATMQIQTS